MVVQAARQRAQNLVDRVAPPDTRRQVYSNLSQFSTEQPLLASFIFVQVVLSALPVLLFTSFALGTVFLSLIAAVAFSLFWVGLALLVLVPTLFITFSVGIFVWLWAVGTWLAISFAYRLSYDHGEKSETFIPAASKNHDGTMN